jgi:hypothetical protein
MAKKEKFKAGWAFGVLALAIILLIIGRMTSEGLRETNNIPDNLEVGVDDIEINGDSPINAVVEDEAQSTTGSTFQLGAPEAPDTN